MGRITVGDASSDSAVRQDFQGLRHVSEGFLQRAFARVRNEMIGQRGASGPSLHGSAAISPSFGGSGLGAGALHEIIAGECRELQDVFFRLQSVESAIESRRLSSRAARGLRYQSELLRGRLAHRALLQEAEECVSLQKNAQQFRARLQALVPCGRMGGRGLGSGEDGLVLVEAAALRDARDAAASMQRSVRDAIAVAVRRAEERVHSSWECAWDRQREQLRRERKRARPLAERMRSARGLSRRAQALGSRCYAMCKPLLEARSRGEAPTWGLVMPLVDAADDLMREADALSARTGEVCAAMGRPVEEEVVAPSQEGVESSQEWQEWEVEASLPRGGAPGELASLRPTAVTVRLQAAARGWMVRRRARAAVEEGEGGSASDDDEYASAEEEAAEASERGEEEAREGELELLALRVGAGARCGAGWPRADARASGDG